MHSILGVPFRITAESIGLAEWEFQDQVFLPGQSGEVTLGKCELLPRGGGLTFAKVEFRIIDCDQDMTARFPTLLIPDQILRIPQNHRPLIPVALYTLH